MADLFVAHTPPPDGTHWHSLKDHLAATAELAQRFAKPLGFGELARAAGLLHDIGKCSDEFQQYLRDCHRAAHQGVPAPRPRLDHKSAGALMAAEVCEMVVPVLLGHHGGMLNLADVGPRLDTAVDSTAVREALERAKMVVPGPVPSAEALAGEVLALAPTELDADLLIRLLYSCLVDSDALDTERHFSPAAADLRDDSVALSAVWEAFERDQRQLMEGSPDTLVNRVRREVYENCLAAAELPPGVFRLTVPTGGGKTRSAFAFAVRHALQHGLQRVIYAIPYTSIIEQTADVFRNILGDPRAVLEHHSAVEPDDPEEETERWRGLACENWDAPLVVTTTVQLFESLFAARPHRCRKVHHVARSVIILDEVQTLPLPLLSPILDILRSLVTRYGTTVVLCTATQPALEGNSRYLQGLPEAREIIREPSRHFRELRRVNYRMEPEPWTWEQTATAMRQSPQCLAVLNTKKDSLRLLETLEDPDALYLSTLLCPAHRRRVLEQVRERLKAGLPCRLVSTQVIEAGVDVDFPRGLRAEGPLDRIAQAAGRVNREGLLPGGGEVIVFRPAEGGMPLGPYKTATAHAVQMLSDLATDLHDPEVFAAYFRRLFQDVDLDRHQIQHERKKLRFANVASKFRLIDKDTVAVLVPYDRQAVEALVTSVQRAGFVSRAAWREAQQHSVAIYRHEFQKWLADGLICEVVPGSGLYRWLGSYHPVCGLSSEALDPADLMA